MSRTSIRQRAGILAIRAVIWLLALVAAAGAVLSIDSVLRNRSAQNDAGAPPVILPPPAAGGDRSAAKAIETAAKAVAALGTGLSGAPRQDTSVRDAGAPAFDIARVEPSGDTVIAGRAAPGATVELLRNGKVHDRAVADASGQFAMVPPKLPAGDSELTLRSKPPGGAPATSKQTVVVAVQPNLKDQPIVALMAPEQPSVVLSKPSAPEASTGPTVVETVEAAAGGRRLFVTGHTTPGALVRLYLNDSYHSTATADGSGRVAFAAASDGAAGRDYRVRLDEVDRASGVVKSRAEVPFTTPQAVAAAAVPEAGETGDGASGPVADKASVKPPNAQKGKKITVSRGDSLWRISRLAYGDGARYTIIYDANHQQIRNPNRIYPGQIFLVPRSRER